MIVAILILLCVLVLNEACKRTLEVKAYIKRRKDKSDSTTSEEKRDMAAVTSQSKSLSHFARSGDREGYYAKARIPSHERRNIYDGQYL